MKFLANSVDSRRFRRDLLHWYDGMRRDLPWRGSRDPYAIWVSEVMLQQTRVGAVLPYYQRFLTRFPDVETLARAREQDLLAAWAGLGYYSRARNLQKAARQIVERGAFPRDHDALRTLAGVGGYTAAAVASIAFGEPRAAVDGNALRVLSRVVAEPGEIGSAKVRKRLAALAGELMDRRRPGDFNQAMMDLGATVCLPRTGPRCLLCPVSKHCRAYRSGRQAEFPVKAGKAPAVEVSHRLLVIERGGAVLLWQRPEGSTRMAGFWELPQAEQLRGASVGAVAGEFRHTIVNTRYRFEVARASMEDDAAGFAWVMRKNLHKVPLSTTAKKALACLKRQARGFSNE